MANAELQKPSEAHINPNPFDSAVSEDGDSWARHMASANVESPETSPTSKGDSSIDKSKGELSSDEDDHLGTVQSVKEKLHISKVKATGATKSMHPTHVEAHLKWKTDGGGLSKTISGATLRERAFLWRSRDNRKGKGSIAIPVAAITSPMRPLRAPFQVKHVARNIWRMMTTFAYWDMAFWSGWAYSCGSVLFVINGAWAWKEVAMPGSEIPGLTKYGTSLLFFFGAIFYQIGATMAYLEAVNDGSFEGSAMRRLMEGHEMDSKQLLDEHIRWFFGHLNPRRSKKKQQQQDVEKAADSIDPEAGWKTKDRHSKKINTVYPEGKAPAPKRRGGFDLGAEEEGKSSPYLKWRWWPTWHALFHHHIYEIGYVACSIQGFGATLYGMTAIVLLPGIFSSLSDWQTEAAFYIPDIVASCCFLVASILFTLETQQNWWRIEPGILGWWIGAWATLGSVGFLLSGITGAISYDFEWGEYQTDLSSMWGSAAYLISSLLQWYEAINKHPVEEEFNEPGEMKSSQIHPV